VNELLDDAVRLIAESFDQYGIEIRKQYDDLPPILLDKQRLMLVFTNLVKNAKDALIEPANKRRVLTLRTRAENDQLVITVGDTGIGIMRENLTRIFSHGFTTKSSGHGFGLHDCANAAAEMGGSLSVHSDGPMKGATFVLNLPLRSALVMA
jgi:two-component system, NtrC family, sensor kinase